MFCVYITMYYMFGTRVRRPAAVLLARMHAPAGFQYSVKVHATGAISGGTYATANTHRGCLAVAISIPQAGAIHDDEQMKTAEEGSDSAPLEANKKYTQRSTCTSQQCMHAIDRSGTAFGQACGMQQSCRSCKQ